MKRHLRRLNPLTLIDHLYWSVNPRLKTAILTGLLTLSFVLGGAVNNTLRRPVHHWHGIEVEASAPLVGGPGVSQSIEMWKKEIARRFPDAFVYFGHGGDFLGQWIGMDEDGSLVTVKELAKRLKARYPDRVIVLLMCNPGHYDLGVPGVYHAMDSVWFFTDKDSDNTDADRHAEPEIVGNIFEFTDR